MIRQLDKLTFSCVSHFGSSMNPTLRDFDIIYVLPVEGNEIRVGDVISFYAIDNSKLTTHRVVSVQSGCLTTRGDNNGRVDPDPIQFENVFGRVMFARRGERIIRINGGMARRLRNRLRNVYRMMRKAALKPLKSLSYRFLQSNKIRNLIARYIEIHVYSFKKARGVDLKLFIGRRLIGVFPAGAKSWRIDFPFRFILSEDELRSYNKKSGPKTANDYKDRSDYPIKK
jgi:signal peptidase I